MSQTGDRTRIPASRVQIEEAVWMLMKTLQLHPDAPRFARCYSTVLKSKELLVADVSDAIQAKRPSIFALNNTMQTLLAHCDYFPHREEIAPMLGSRCGQNKKEAGVMHHSEIAFIK